MRRTVIAGNWKMNKDLSEAVKLISEIKSNIAGKPENTDVIIFPPYISLETAFTLIKNSEIKLGAQNMHHESSGAFTAEISAPMLKSVGCEYVILGHSERRSIFGETDELINIKLKKAFAEELKPVFCIGETLEQREAGTMQSVIKNQVVKGLSEIPESDIQNLIIAYEPVWAIGTGKTATPEQAEEVHLFIRNLIAELYSAETADNLVIQYGGSVKPSNAKSLLSQSNIDGALIGGACLNADSFVEVIKTVE